MISQIHVLGRNVELSLADIMLKCVKKMSEFICLNFDYTSSASFFVKLFEQKQIFFIINFRVGTKRPQTSLNIIVMRFSGIISPSKNPNTRCHTVQTFHSGKDNVVEERLWPTVFMREI